MPTADAMDIDEIDRALEVALLIRDSELGHARGCRHGSDFGAAENGRRLDAFILGVLDTLTSLLRRQDDSLHLLVYLKALVEHGPGSDARAATARSIALRGHSELRRYIAGGRSFLMRLLAGERIEPGLFARLLEKESNPH